MRILWAILHDNAAGIGVHHFTQLALTAVPTVKLHDLSCLLMESAEISCVGMDASICGYLRVSWRLTESIAGIPGRFPTPKTKPTLALVARIAGIAGICARKCWYSHLWDACSTSLACSFTHKRQPCRPLIAHFLWFSWQVLFCHLLCCSHTCNIRSWACNALSSPYE